MNHSIYNADSATHVKIVVLGLYSCFSWYLARVSEGRAQIAKTIQLIGVSGHLPIISSHGEKLIFRGFNESIDHNWNQHHGYEQRDFL